MDDVSDESTDSGEEQEDEATRVGVAQDQAASTNGDDDGEVKSG